MTYLSNFYKISSNESRYLFKLEMSFTYHKNKLLKMLWIHTL